MNSKSDQNIFIKHDIRVMDSFIAKFAQKYIAQRSKSIISLSALNNNQVFNNSGFSTARLEDIIRKNSIAHVFKRENGVTPSILNDIYRSDFGELLMTYYFEEKLDQNSRFVIPLKNITYREREDMPGRGIDAIGYKISDTVIDILLSEAKVSAEKKNPPAVVHQTEDSIYATHLKYANDLQQVIRRLSDYCRRLGTDDAAPIGLAILSMDSKEREKYSITLGCTLIRDFTCVDADKDFGKMKSDADNFKPRKVHFSILSFTEKAIEETVQLFYKKVQELIK